MLPWYKHIMIHGCVSGYKEPKQFERTNVVTENLMSDEGRHGSSTILELSRIIDAPVDHVFPLACPVLEYKWIPGWKCKLIHCPNGRVELGTVFDEISSAPMLGDSIAGKTTWTAVLHDPETHRLHFRLDNRISSSLYRIEFEPTASGGTLMSLHMTYTPRGEKEVGERKKRREAKIKLMLSIITLMLTHYSEQGEMIDPAEAKKLVAQFREITLADKMRLLLNKLAKKHLKDEDRTKFLKGLPVRKVLTA